MVTRTRIVRSLFGIAVTAALGFGASELRAGEQSCSYDPWTYQLGPCYAGDCECAERCRNEIPGSPGGTCMDPGNCCICVG